MVPPPNSSISASLNLVFTFCCLLAFPGHAGVVINEVMFHPPGDPGLPEPVAEEYLEFLNTGSETLSLEGWEIDDGVALQFPAVTIPPGGVVVAAADPAVFAAKYPGVRCPVVGPWSGRLSNGGERIRLRNAKGEEVDEVTYADEGDWAVRRRGPLDNGHQGWVWESTADGEGGSLELITPDLSNEEGQNWQATSPGNLSPGRPNGSARSDPAPLILDVAHSPAIPDDNDRVVITAKLRDLPGAPLSAVVSYGTDSNSAQGRSEILMTDDALNGDGAAGDGIFGATLPAFPAGTVVDFYVWASDGTRTRTWPGPTDEQGRQGANALFQVEAPGLASDQGLPEYRVILSPAEQAEFAFSSFNWRSNAQMNATFIARLGEDIDVRYQSGIRRRGAGSRRRNPRTCRLTLPSDRPWQGSAEMNLNSQFNYLQLFGQKLFAAANLPSAGAQAVEFFLNGEDQAVENERLFGAYVHLQPQGGDSVARQFPDDPNGSLYSKRRPDRKLAYRAGNVEAYLADGWSKESNRSEADWSDLDAWLQALQDTENPDYLDNLKEVMDIDQWVRWLAVMALIANGETNLSNGADDDYYVYAGRSDPRIKAVPHDLDTILGLGDGSAITNPRHTIYDFIEDDDVLPVLEPFIRHPEVMPKYHRALRELIDGPFSKAKFDELLRQCLRQRIPAFVQDGMIAFMDARRSYVRSLVDLPLTVTSDLPEVDGVPLSVSARASLSGTLNLAETSRVTVNGREATIDPVAGTWSFGGEGPDQVALINSGASWRYLDDGSNQGVAWRENGFDDSSWKTGDGEFGFGDGDENTQILYGPNVTNLINFFTNRNNKFVTTYFRKTLSVPDPAEFADILLRLKSDDGAAVYLNGELQVLDLLPPNAGFETFALSSRGEPEEDEFQEFVLPATSLQVGENVIAVEIHNSARDDDDLSFDLALIGRNSGDFGDDDRLLSPGMNALVVEAFHDDGSLLETSSHRIWYNDGNVTSLSGRLDEDLLLEAAEGPYVVESDLIVPPGVTLTIEAGTTVFFRQGVGLRVLGRLVADGRFDRRIQLTVEPGRGESWEGLALIDSDEDSRLAWVDQSFATSGAQSIEVRNARLTLEQVRWLNTSETVLEVRHPKMRVIDCEFPPTAGHEVIHGTDLEGDEFFHLRGNVFQSSTGYNDIIDFSGGRRPGPIIYVMNNLFQGGTDDCLDFDGIDAHIEGNIFLNIHTDDPARPSTSNAIATDGDAHLTIVRNVFDDIDHALLLKNESDALFENNVVRRATLGAISFREPLRPEVTAGSDVICRGNIFVDNAVTFRFPDHLRGGGDPPRIVADGNLLPLVDHSYGVGNLDGDPAFVDAPGGDFSLLPGSVARGSGINGADMGVAVPRGAILAGEPRSPTTEGSARLTVHMPGISGIERGEFVTEYRWRLNQGPWSDPVAVEEAITLDDLPPGSYQVDVSGKDSNGIWQEEPTSSRVWQVVEEIPAEIWLHEVVVDHGDADGWVELHNRGSLPLDLGGYRISNDVPGEPGLVFPGGTVLSGGGFLQVFSEGRFSLDPTGDAVFLLQGTRVVDSISFGHQLADYSLSRNGFEGEWGLAVPTPSEPNQRAGTGDPRRVRINEWTANSGVVVSGDFVEFFNPGRSPVDLGGLFLTENPGGEIRQKGIPAFTFVDAGGLVALPFSMDADSRQVALYTPEAEEIDLVVFHSQVEDTSYVRLPDGAEWVGGSGLPTPGLPNGSDGEIRKIRQTPLIAFDGTWRYDQSGNDLGNEWREVDFDDSRWASGPGLLGFEDDPLPGPGINTEFRDPSENDPYVVTYYFRQDFEFTGDPAANELVLQSIIDDAVVVYLNGEELYRQGIGANPSFDTFADASGDASRVGPVMVSSEHLRMGTNVVAAEVHQTSSGSSDIVFGLALRAEEEITEFFGGPEFLEAQTLIKGLRISELMFHPAEGDEYEFIELENIGPEVLELAGLRFIDGIYFTFPTWSLAPGESVLVVSDRIAFERKYGSSLPIAGEYEGQLSNGGERVTLQLPAPFEVNVQEFSYRDDWDPAADGGGRSLEIIDLRAPARDWNERLLWRAGGVNGSPGAAWVVDAGEAQTTLVSFGATLRGALSPGWSPGLVWEQLAGPAPALLSDPGSLNPRVSFTLPGTYRFRISAREGASELTAETTVAVDDLYPIWERRHQLQGASGDDEDGDGIDNLMEYALDLNPKVPDWNPPLILDGGAFRYPRFLRKPDLVYEVERSEVLNDWVGQADRLLFAGPDQQIRVFSLPGGSREFVRLKIVR